MTGDAMWNQFPHLSPDGRNMVFLSYEENREVPGDRDAVLRMMSIADKKIKVLAKLRGDESTLGASPWSLDGKRIVLVSYQVK
jgi:Tol biopolymer transport system component